jgi:hypothetical protein
MDTSISVMDLLHDTSTETFSDVLVEPQDQLLRITQPGDGIHAAVRVALGQEVVKSQGDLVILGHLWSLYELFRYKADPPLCLRMKEKDELKAHEC